MMIPMLTRHAPYWLATVALMWCAVTPATCQPAAAAPAQIVIRSWGYQLSNVEPAEIAASGFDAVVIDYARDGTQANALTATDIERMKVKLDGSRRVVLAYLSIGEAEQYRYYWNTRWNWLWGWYAKFFGPQWLGAENRDWRGNFAVRYWMDEWQTLICGPGNSYLGRIIAAGFDGVWLDKVDTAFEPIAATNKTAADDMVTFVARIAARARLERPGFLIIPQNGEELLVNPQYRTLIDGMGAESLLYGDPDEKKPTAPDVQSKRLPLLSSLVSDGKPVLAVEYLDDASTIAATRQRLQQLGFTPHFADRNLDHLRLTDVPGPSAGKR